MVAADVSLLQTPRKSASKSIHTYVRSHPFFRDSTKSFTTSGRRAFLRSVYDYSRALGLAKSDAKKRVIKARSMCGEEEYDTDDTTLDNEINDSESILNAMRQEESNPAQQSLSNGSHHKKHAAATTKTLKLMEERGKHKLDFDEIDAPSAQQSPRKAKKPQNNESLSQSKKRKRKDKEAATQDPLDVAENNLVKNHVEKDGKSTEHDLDLTNAPVELDAPMDNGILAQSKAEVAQEANNSDAPNAQLQKEEIEMERKAGQTGNPDQFSWLSKMDFLYQPRDSSTAEEDGGNKTQELRPPQNREKTRGEGDKDVNMESKESTTGQGFKKKSVEEKNLQRKAKQAEKEKQKAQQEERRGFWAALRTQVASHDEETSEDNAHKKVTKLPAQDKQKNLEPKKHKKRRVDHEDGRAEKTKDDAPGLTPFEVRVETPKQKKQYFKEVRIGAESSPDRDVADPAIQELSEEKENDRRSKKKKKKKRKSGVSRDNELAKPTDF